VSPILPNHQGWEGRVGEHHCARLVFFFGLSVEVAVVLLGKVIRDRWVINGVFCQPNESAFRLGGNPVGELDSQNQVLILGQVDRLMREYDCTVEMGSD
jgi:hypothetical protein